MLIGHFGLAQLAKPSRRDVAIGWLAVAAYLPDLVRVPIGLILSQTRTEWYSHSVPAVAALAILIGAVWKSRRGSWLGSAALAALCLLHWPADALTGCKPTWPGHSWVGLYWYRHPLTNLPVEAALFLAGWYLVRRHTTSLTIRRPVVPVAAVFLQVAFLLSMYFESEFYIGNRQFNWQPVTGSILPTEVREYPLRCAQPPS